MGKTGLLCLLFLWSSCTQLPPETSRKKLNFNTSWAFHRGDIPGGEKTNLDDSDFEAVSLPHVMRLEKKHNGGNVFQGVGWYRRYFRVPESFRNKRLTIRFEGVQTNCDIYVNGKKISEHHGGYTGFVVDITGKVNFERDNVLAVRVSNEDDPQTPPGKPASKLDFNYYGGIYRDVCLLATNRVYISDPLEAEKVAGGGLYVSFRNVSGTKADVYVKTNVVNSGFREKELTLTSSILDRKGNVVAESIGTATVLPGTDMDFEQELTVLDPELWHPDQPYLYRLVSKVSGEEHIFDKKITKIGIRSLSFRSPGGKADGFYINGEKLYIRGANRHQAYQYVGDAASKSMQWRDALQLKKGGFNAVRAAHYPPSPEFLNACDSLGLLVVECQPGWQFFNTDSTFIQRSFRDIRHMIRRDRNHPSVFLWETSLNESPTPEWWMEKAVRIGHDEMPGGQFFTADDYNVRSKDHYDVFYKFIRKDGTVPEPVHPSLTREWGDTWLADAFEENGLRASRIYTEKGLINQCILRQNALNGETAEDMGGYWDHAGLDANPGIGGYFVWSFNDYTRGYDPVTAFSGVVDIDRYEKFSYYYLRSMQDARNPAYGPNIFIASYNNRPDLDHEVLVFSNCDTVKLYRNGHLVAEQSRKENSITAPFIAGKGGSPYFRFDLKQYESGTLRAEGILDGKTVCEHVVRTPQEPYRLDIKVPQEEEISPFANGSDMIPFYVKVVDKNGTLISIRRVPETFNINIDVSGAGDLIGGNNPHLEIARQQTEGGIAYGIVRTSETPGEIVIKAQSEGLLPGLHTVTTKPYKGQHVNDGKHVNWIGEYHKKYDKNAKAGERETSAPINMTSISVSQVKIEGENPGENGKHLADGQTSTSWTSKTGIFPKKVTLEIEEATVIKGVRILWGKDSDWYTFRVSGSIDGEHWIDLTPEEERSGQSYQPILFGKPQEMKFIQIRVHGIRPENSNVAIKDIEVYQ